MAFTEFACRASGSNLNAGTRTGNSTEAGTSPFKTYASGTWVQATRTFTPAGGANPTTDGIAVGDFVSIAPDATTGDSVYIARISTVGATTFVTDATAKSGTAPADGAVSTTARIGGAWLGPNGASGFPFSFVNGAMVDAATDPVRVNFKNDQTYNITAAMAVANNGPFVFQGYTSTFGDGGKATFDGGTSGASYALLTTATSAILICDLILQNNGASGSAAGLVISAGRNAAERCVVNSVRGAGFSLTNQTTVLACEAYTCNQSNTASIGGFTCTSSCSFDSCVSHDHSGSNAVGFQIGATSTLLNCIADTNGSHGFAIASVNPTELNQCVAYNNGGSGVSAASGAHCYTIKNSVFAQNAAYGVIETAASSFLRVSNCAFYSNTSGQTGTVPSSSAYIVSGSVTLSASPFVDAANGDFRLNSTAGAGAACRGAGIGTFTQTAASYAGTVGYPDVGAAQHRDITGGGAPFPVYKALLYEADYQDSPY